jgi:hypothetical protein
MYILDIPENSTQAPAHSRFLVLLVGLLMGTFSGSAWIVFGNKILEKVERIQKSRLRSSQIRQKVGT